MTSVFLRLVTGKLRYSCIHCGVKRVKRRYRTIYTSTHSLENENQHEDIHLNRNIGIMAHIDAGKTTTTERMLYFSGFSRHLGDVDRGDTVTDYMEEERERGITIVSAAVTFYWNKHKINLIDTPGHVDFTVEVERALRVLDGAVTVLDASAGVEAQTLTVWRQANRYNIPRIIFLNKMDKFGANFNMCLKSIKEQLHVDPIPINLPIGKERTFSGVVDLVSLEQKLWNLSDSGDGRTFSSEIIDLSEKGSSTEAVSNARAALIGQLTEYDDKIAEWVLNDTKLEDIPVNDIKHALRKVTLSGKAVLVLCGSSKRNIAVQPLMDAIVNYLPCPTDIKHDFLQYYGKNLCALAFKIVHDQQRGALTYARIYGGTLKCGSTIYNVNMSSKDRIGQLNLYQVNADEYKRIKESGPGNIVCIAGLDEVRTGDTLTVSAEVARTAANLYRKYSKKSRNHSDSEDADDIDGSVLAGMEVPPPVFFCSIEAPSITKQTDMEKALKKMQREDPSLQVHVDKETSQLILSGMGELHIEIIKHRLEKEHGVDAYLGPLQIAYKEKIGVGLEHTSSLENVIDKKSNLVTMTIKLVPTEESTEFKEVKYVGEEIPILTYKQRNAINNGVKSALSYGPVFGSNVVDTDVVLTALVLGQKTPLSFLQASAYECVRQALNKAECFLMEPVMALDVQTDKKNVHVVRADILKRRGEIKQLTSQNDSLILHTLTPLAELVGYSTTLRSLTSGTATFTMELDHYCQLSRFEQDKVSNSNSISY